MTLASRHDINDETAQSCVEEIDTLREAMKAYPRRGSLYFEYNIPRMSRRADVIVLVDGIVFVVEYKTAEQRFTREAIVQVWDYALDPKNFQEGYLDRILIPILVSPREKDSHCQLTMKHFEDMVYEPLMVNNKKLPEVFGSVLDSVDAKINQRLVTTSGPRVDTRPHLVLLNPKSLFINRIQQRKTQSMVVISTRIRMSRPLQGEKKRKAICFITGVPGAGKTLIALNTAIDQFNRGENAIYLSGNFPLAEVLKEVLTRDYVRRDKIRAKDEKRKACTKQMQKAK